MNIIILAAGKGTRMNQDLPKVLTPLGDKTFIEHVLASVGESEVQLVPHIVIGHESSKVKTHLKDMLVKFIEQDEQLGTGHAVHVCRDHLDTSQPVLVLYGDHALLQPETIQRLRASFEKHQPAISMVTYRVPDFSVFNGAFQKYGRILRNENENMYAIREAKDATLEELSIREVNPAYFLFDGPWLWENLKNLGTSNAQSEYYLTDLVELAIEQGKMVDTIVGDDLTEAIGVNTPEQLVMAEKIYQSRT
jgi:bifunctional UDP-N-acetylglucosamine pyrophosphorylase / glucosamine-1-phosphate N-acetyltransferase